jgi:hypothetical protein
MFVPEVKNLYPASQLAPEEKKPYAFNTGQMIMGYTEAGSKIDPAASLYEYATNDEDRGMVIGGKYNPKAMLYANQLADGMVNADKSNGLEEYFPKGMSTEFINALAKSGYVPGFEDKDTLKAVAKIVDLRMADDAKGTSGEFDGQFNTFVEQRADGYHIGLYTSTYTGRDGSWEKTYKESDVKPIMVIPHDEISKRITSTKIAATPTEIYNSKSYVKAQALRNYLDALLMTSDF